MSMVQDCSQLFQSFGGDAQASLHTKRHSALGAHSMSYCSNGNSVSTGMASGTQGFGDVGGGVHSSSWQAPPLSSSSSPSIWSHQYNGGAQWPSSSHNRHNSVGIFPMHSSQSFAPRPTIPNNVAMPIHSQAQHVPNLPSSMHTGQHQRNYSAANPVPVHLVQGYHNMQQPMVNYGMQPVMLVPHPPMQQPVPSIPHIHHPHDVIQQQSQQIQQHQTQQPQQPQFHHLLQAPRLMPHYIHPIVHSQMPLYQRAAYHAPVENCNANNIPATEYDVHMFSKFMVSVCIGIVEDVLTPDEMEKLESFIQTMLFATRLQLSTLFMSLVFLNRANKLCHSDYLRLPLRKRLVCSLILANKMHDDNTFTNASWSVVSDIPTKEITSLEARCLKAFNWDLSLGESGTSEWQYWQNCWAEFLQKLQTPSPVNSPPFDANGNIQFATENFTIAAAC